MERTASTPCGLWLSLRSQLGWLILRVREGAAQIVTPLRQWCHHGCIGDQVLLRIFSLLKLPNNAIVTLVGDENVASVLSGHFYIFLLLVHFPG